MRWVGLDISKILILSIFVAFLVSVSTLSIFVANAIILDPTKTTLSPNPGAIVIGTTIALHAKVLDSNSTTKTIPTGTVSWSDGGAGGSFNATSCTLSQYSTSTSTSICNIAYTPPAKSGPVTINGTYSGDSTHKTSFGTSALTVNLRVTKTAVTPNPATTSIGALITFYAKIVDSSSGTKGIPTGTVSWSDGGVEGSFSSSSCMLAQYGTSTSTSICSIKYNPPANAGPVTITGTYSGDSIHNTSSGTSPLTVALRGTSTTVSPNPATTTIGTPITFQVKIVDSSSGTKGIPTGTVSWSDGGAGGSFNAVSCALTQYRTSTSESVCTIVYTPPANIGTPTITATYSGDGRHGTSFGLSALTVNAPPTGTSAVSYNLGDQASCQSLPSGSPTWFTSNATCHINDLTLNQGTSLILNTGVCCLTLTITGTFNNYGTVNNVANIYNYGTINNYGKIFNGECPKNNEDCPIGNLYNYGAINNHGWFDNVAGTITNSGTISNLCGGQIDNHDTISGNPVQDGCGIPSSPTYLSANSFFSSQIFLSWFAPGYNGSSTITGYNIYRSTSSGTETFLASTGNVLSYIDTPVTNGQTYFYRVTAVNSAGESLQSNQASAMPSSSNSSSGPGAPQPPTGLTATQGNVPVTLTWSSSNNGGYAITNYNLYRSTSSGAETFLVSISPHSTSGTSWSYNSDGTIASGSYTDGSAINGKTYFYKITAVNSAGESLPSNEASTTLCAPSCPNPLPPTGLKATPAPYGWINLTWTASSDNGGYPITGYNVYRATASGGEVIFIETTPSSTFSWTDGNGLTCGQTYYYKVNAVNSVGVTSAISNEANATSTCTSTGLPTVVYMQDTTASFGLSTYSGRQIQAEYVNSSSVLVGKQIDTISVQLKKVGSPTGNATIGVFYGDLSFKKSFANVTVSALTTSYKNYTFSLPNSVPPYQIQAGDRIGIKFAGGNSTFYVGIMTDQNSADPFDGANSYLTYYTTAWKSFTSNDLTMTLQHGHS